VKIISNPVLVGRSRRLGKGLNIAGLIVALVSAVLVFTHPETDLLSMYGLLLVAFLLWMVSNYFTNRFNRIPPAEEAVDGLLKGLNDSYTSIHYRLKHDHALFTPNGIIAVVPRYEHGEIQWTDNKSWRQSGVSRLRKLFSSEAVGNPVEDGRFAAEQLAGSLQKIIKSETAPEVRPVVVFVHSGTMVDAANSPVPALPASKFKEYIRKLEKRTNLTPDQMRMVLEFCGEKS
jgi:hypothetical protein